jgi:hypothetical protein
MLDPDQLDNLKVLIACNENNDIFKWRFPLRVKSYFQRVSMVPSIVQLVWILHYLMLHIMN